MIALLQTKYGVKQQMWAREIVKHVEEHVENEDPATTEASGAENTRKKPLTFCVEGNISVGKSTFLRQIVSKTIILKVRFSRPVSRLVGTRCEKPTVVVASYALLLVMSQGLAQFWSRKRVLTASLGLAL